MESYISKIIHILEEQEETLNQSPTLLQFEEVSRSLIQLAYNMVEHLDDLQQKLSILEYQLFINDEQYQKDIKSIQCELTEQKRQYQQFMETCMFNEENHHQNESYSSQRTQALESQLKVLELDLLSQQLKFSECMKYYEEELTKKNIIITKKDLQEKNKSEPIHDQVSDISINEKKRECLAIPKVLDPTHDYVSINCLERVEENKYLSNYKINVQKCSQQGSLASLDLCTTKNVQLMKIPTIESNLEYPKRIIFSNLQSKFTSYLHIRSNSIGINLPMNNNSNNKSDSSGKENSNSYQHFFLLISQCVKLDLQINELYTINPSHLYDQFIQSKTPFNKWYHEIKLYLLSQLK